MSIDLLAGGKGHGQMMDFFYNNMFLPKESDDCRLQVEGLGHFDT